MHDWQIQEAKARLSEVVEAAGSQWPQGSMVHGRSVAVVLSRSGFDRSSGAGESLVGFMFRSPLAGDEDLEFLRDGSLTREEAL